MRKSNATSTCLNLRLVVSWCSGMVWEPLQSFTAVSPSALSRPIRYSLGTTAVAGSVNMWISKRNQLIFISMNNNTANNATPAATTSEYTEQPSK